MLNIKSMSQLHFSQIKQERINIFSSRKSLLFVSLVFALLVSSFSSCMLMAQGFATIPSDDVVYVRDDDSLRKAITDTAVLGGPVVIVFERNIALIGSTLTIPAGADVTLTSDIALASSAGVEFFRLFGVAGYDTITVNGGTLVIDGIIVTHVLGSSGNGVTVNSGGILTLSSGRISDNTVGDVIFSNGFGGGVFVGFDCSFVMSGGVISGNTVSGGSSSGGGVYIGGSFVMSGGVISGNTAHGSGGGVYIGRGGSFVLENCGAISDNLASSNYDSQGGGGVYVSGGSFVMKGGVIFDNTAHYGGGVYISYDSIMKSSFVMSGGVVSGNTATTALTLKHLNLNI